MIHCSYVEGFSPPLSSGLFILGVEDPVIFEELVLRLRFTPMVFVLVKISKIWVWKRRR